MARLQPSMDVLCGGSHYVLERALATMNLCSSLTNLHRFEDSVTSVAVHPHGQLVAVALGAALLVAMCECHCYVALSVICLRLFSGQGGVRMLHSRGTLGSAPGCKGGSSTSRTVLPGLHMLHTGQVGWSW